VRWGREEWARYPLHPRLGRLIVESRKRGVAEGRLYGRRIAQRPASVCRPAPPNATRSDLLVLMESDWEPRASQMVRQVRRIVNPAAAGGREERGEWKTRC